MADTISRLVRFVFQVSQGWPIARVLLFPSGVEHPTRRQKGFVTFVWIDISLMIWPESRVLANAR